MTEKDTIIEETPKQNKNSFSLQCPKCRQIITTDDFSQDQLSAFHLQEYFKKKENEYKSFLLKQIEKEIESFTLVKELRSIIEKLKGENGKLNSWEYIDNLPVVKELREKNVSLQGQLDGYSLAQIVLVVERDKSLNNTF